MGLMPWEKTTTCPYNPAHQITIERIQSHLIKCRRNHPNSNHVICPFNASHHIPQVTVVFQGKEQLDHVVTSARGTFPPRQLPG